MTGGRWLDARPDCRSESGLLTLDSCTAVEVDMDVGIAGVGEPVGRVVSFKNALRLPRAATATYIKGTLEKIPTVFLLFIASSEPEAEQ